MENKFRPGRTIFDALRLFPFHAIFFACKCYKTFRIFFRPSVERLRQISDHLIRCSKRYGVEAVHVIQKRNWIYPMSLTVSHFRVHPRNGTVNIAL